MWGGAGEPRWSRGRLGTGAHAYWSVPGLAAREPPAPASSAGAVGASLSRLLSLPPPHFEVVSKMLLEARLWRVEGGHILRWD